MLLRRIRRRRRRLAFGLGLLMLMLVLGLGLRSCGRVAAGISSADSLQPAVAGAQESTGLRDPHTM
ncbi:MAG: hypothetical protein R3F46_04290 [bacterium]